MIAADMPLEISTLLAVLAHEIRGPVSTLQGYLRLLEQRRGPGGTDPAVIEAMRRSTVKLAALGTEASDLANWLAAPSPRPHHSVSIGSLLQEASQRSTVARMAADGADSAMRSEVEVLDLALIARALAALAAAVARDHEQAPSTLTAELTDDVVAIYVRPDSTESQDQSSGPLPPASSATGMVFDRGGMGLELALASYVLDAHGATVSTDSCGGMTVRLPRGLPK